MFCLVPMHAGVCEDFSIDVEDELNGFVDATGVPTRLKSDPAGTRNTPKSVPCTEKERKMGRATGVSNKSKTRIRNQSGDSFTASGSFDPPTPTKSNKRK